jgi:hypothetical protein
MMRLKKFTPNGAGYEAYYRCTNCDVDSPHVYAESTEEAESKAYKAATSLFCNPCNRELTMEEVRQERLVWSMLQDGDSLYLLCWYAENDFFDFFIVLESPMWTYDATQPTIMQLIKEPKELTKTRFWLRKPTEEEQKKEWRDGNE